MGLFSGVGKILNDITGATSSAKQAQNYTLQQMAQSNIYSKEFAQNAHQWEVEDLKNAKLNPILSANGGTSASGGQIGGASTPTSGISPIDVITNLASAKNLIADAALKGAQELKTLTENGLLPEKTAQEIAESRANEKFQNERARGYSESESTSESTQYGNGFSNEFKVLGTGTGTSTNYNTARQRTHSKARTF